MQSDHHAAAALLSAETEADALPFDLFVLQPCRHWLSPERIWTSSRASLHLAFCIRRASPHASDDDRRHRQAVMVAENYARRQWQAGSESRRPESDRRKGKRTVPGHNPASFLERGTRNSCSAFPPSRAVHRHQSLSCSTLALHLSQCRRSTSTWRQSHAVPASACMNEQRRHRCPSRIKYPLTLTRRLGKNRSVAGSKGRRLSGVAAERQSAAESSPVPSIIASVLQQRSDRQMLTSSSLRRRATVQSTCIGFDDKRSQCRGIISVIEERVQAFPVKWHGRLSASGPLACAACLAALLLHRHLTERTGDKVAAVLHCVVSVRGRTTSVEGARRSRFCDWTPQTRACYMCTPAPLTEESSV